MYGRLWIFTRVLIPMLGSLTLIFFAIQGLTNEEFVLGMFMVTAFISNSILERVFFKNYVGDLEVDETPRGKRYSLSFNRDPSDLDENDKIVFRVKKIP